MSIAIERERQDQSAPGEAPDREAVTGGYPGDERESGCGERVDQRVHNPAAVEMVAESVEVVPRDGHVAEAAERKRRTGDQRVVRPRWCEDEPEQRDGKEECECNEHERSHSECQASGVRPDRVGWVLLGLRRRIAADEVAVASPASGATLAGGSAHGRA